MVADGPPVSVPLGSEKVKLERDTAYRTLGLEATSALYAAGRTPNIGARSKILFGCKNGKRNPARVKKVGREMTART